LNKQQLEKEFVEKVTESQGIIHKVCRVYCTGEEERTDLFQEILIQLWKSFPSFRGDSRFSTWMYRVSFNVAIQRLRKKNKKPKQVELSRRLKEIPDLPVVDVYEEEIKWLYGAIDRLNEVEKAIIMLFLEDKENGEIAEIIGISRNYVRVKLHRIKSKLKKMAKQL